MALSSRHTRAGALARDSAHADIKPGGRIKGKFTPAKQLTFLLFIYFGFFNNCLIDKHMALSSRHARAGADWHATVLKQMSAMVLEAERERSKALVDSRIAAHDNSALLIRLHGLEGAAEAATQRWEAAASQLLAAQDAFTRLRERRAAHFVERAALQERRLDALTQQLTRSAGQVRRSRCAIDPLIR